MAQADEIRGVMEIGENLRKARERAGLSQQELGHMIGSNGNTIYLYETAQRTMPVNRLCRIADLLSISPLEILPERYANGKLAQLERISSKFEALPLEAKTRAIETLDLLIDGLRLQYGQTRMET